MLAAGPGRLWGDVDGGSAPRAWLRATCERPAKPRTRRPWRSQGPGGARGRAAQDEIGAGSVRPSRRPALHRLDQKNSTPQGAESIRGTTLVPSRAAAQLSTRFRGRGARRLILWALITVPLRLRLLVAAPRLGSQATYDVQAATPGTIHQPRNHRPHSPLPEGRPGRLSEVRLAGYSSRSTSIFSCLATVRGQTKGCQPWRRRKRNRINARRGRGRRYSIGHLRVWDGNRVSPQ